MSEQDNGQVATLQRPTSDDPEEWIAYWEQQGQPWRTEPEIDEERQKYLAERRAIVPDTVKGVYPFRGVGLSRADIEWLLATHDNGRGPVDWDRERLPGTLQVRRGLDFRGVDLRGANLSSLPLAGLVGGDLMEFGPKTDAQHEAESIHLEGAILLSAHLERAVFNYSHLEDVNLYSAYLEGALLINTHLERATLDGAQLKEATLWHAHLEKAKLNANFERALLSNARLDGANLSGANLKTANLYGALQLHFVEGRVLSSQFGV
jgi:uncharacterized protein YjbI with pentapeptide repeats